MPHREACWQRRGIFPSVRIFWRRLKKFAMKPKKMLAIRERLWYHILAVSERSLRYAAVAQLDRVFDYESKGRGFESLLPYG